MNLKETEPKQVLKWAIIIFIIIIALRFGAPLIKSTWNQFKKSSETRSIEELENNINNNKLSYQLAEYSLMANSLFTAMDGMGTNEQVIYNVFNRLKNIDDLYQLITSFGVKSDQTLQQWLIADLSSSELEKVNQLLSSKNINFQF